jgi:hypothetical protein
MGYIHQVFAGKELDQLAIKNPGRLTGVIMLIGNPITEFQHQHQLLSA